MTPMTASTNVWRWRRWLYHAGLVGLFVAVAFYFGPNRILFGRWTWITPADFVPIVRDRCEPVVRLMKEYRLKHGRLPTSNQEIGRKDSWGPGEYAGSVSPRGYEYWGRYNHFITYDFTLGHERWLLRGRFARGPIPYPAVQLSATTQP